MSRRRVRSPSPSFVSEARIIKRPNVDKEDDEQLILALNRHLTSLSSENIRVSTFLSSVVDANFLNRLDIEGRLAYSWNHFDLDLITYGVGQYFDDQDLLQLRLISRHWFTGLQHSDVPATRTVILNLDMMIQDWRKYSGSHKRTTALARSFYSRNCVKFRKASHWVGRHIKIPAFRALLRFLDLLDDRLDESCLCRCPTKLSLVFSIKHSVNVRLLMDRLSNLQHLRLYPETVLVVRQFPRLTSLLLLKSIWIIPLSVSGGEDENTIPDFIRAICVADQLQQVVCRTTTYPVGGNWLQDRCVQLTTFGVIESSPLLSPQSPQYPLTSTQLIRWCFRDTPEIIWRPWHHVFDEDEDQSESHQLTDDMLKRYCLVGDGFSEGERVMKWLTKDRSM
jgi:hypothetical protein